tara:strand:+ start:1388 stop:2221 length:834 start_codon:yes stop_codon:yes gene_type:complete
MKIIRKTKELKNLLDSISNSSWSIGLVLTMGNIHEGHLSLIREAKNNNKFVITSIFINPTQFNNNDDYNLYPKTLDQDILKLKSSNCDLLYLPSVDEIYPNGLIKERSILKYRNILCDVSRPGHFDGVTTVVNTFFNLIKPKNSYFGEKDFQQMKLIDEMVRIKKLNINIIPCSSVRDKNGMSLSSRNSNFSLDQSEIFEKLGKKILLLVESLKQKNLKVNFNEFKKELSKININKIDYLEIRDENSLEITNNFNNARLFIATFIDNIRIIDNFKLY